MKEKIEKVKPYLVKSWEILKKVVAFIIKVMKPIFKKKRYIVLFLIALVILFNMLFKGNNNSKKSEKIIKNDLELGEYLPDLPSSEGIVIVNTDQDLSIKLHGVDKDKFKKFKNESKDKFKNVVRDETNHLTAYNEEDTTVTMYYYNDYEVSLNVNKAHYQGSLNWGNSKLMSMLVKPESENGKITTDSSEKLIVYVTKFDKSKYNEYVNKIMESGFTEAYNKTENKYTAKKDGYVLELSYTVPRTMEITLKKEEPKVETKEEKKAEVKTEVKEEKKEEPKVEVKTPSPAKVETKSGISKEVKEFLDSYERFIDKYVAFMKKYNKSGGTDLSLLSEYSSMLSEYTKQVEKFEKFDDNHQLNSEELSYYLEVQSRVLKKLSEV